jgi:hypothetical protein
VPRSCHGGRGLSLQQWQPRLWRTRMSTG